MSARPRPRRHQRHPARRTSASPTTASNSTSTSAAKHPRRRHPDPERSRRGRTPVVVSLAPQMLIYRQLDQIPAATGPVVATIGNFDGVHLGHQGVIAEVIARARFLGGSSLAITFDPHPARVLRPDHPLPLITPLPRKLELLAATGLDAALVLPFNDALRRTSARDFARPNPPSAPPTSLRSTRARLPLRPPRKGRGPLARNPRPRARQQRRRLLAADSARSSVSSSRIRAPSLGGECPPPHPRSARPPFRR